MAAFQKRRFALVAQKSALDEDRGRGDVFHQEDRRVDGFLRFLVARVDGPVQRELHRIRKLGAPLFFAVEHLCAVRPLGRRKAVLVDADKDRTLRAVDDLYTVFKVRALLFPQRQRAIVVDGDILRARHARLLAEKNEQRVEPPRDGEVHVAFLAAVGGDGTAVLPAVPRVDDPDGLPRRRRHARLDRLRRQEKADGRRRQHEQQREYGVKRLFSEHDKQNTPHPGTMYAPRRGLMYLSLYRTLNKKKSPASLFSPAA